MHEFNKDRDGGPEDHIVKATTLPVRTGWVIGWTSASADVGYVREDGERRGCPVRKCADFGRVGPACSRDLETLLLLKPM